MTLGIFNSKVKHRTCRFDGLLWSDAAVPVSHTACRDSSFNLLTRPLPESIPKILSYFRAGYGQKVDTLWGPGGQAREGRRPASDAAKRRASCKGVESAMAGSMGKVWYDS